MYHFQIWFIFSTPLPSQPSAPPPLHTTLVLNHPLSSHLPPLHYCHIYFYLTTATSLLLQLPVIYLPVHCCFLRFCLEFSTELSRSHSWLGRLALNKPVCNKVVDWSISQSCFGTKYSESESVKELLTAELSAGFQTRQEERYMIWFRLLLGGDST